ncbi:Topoisomerase DNA binding C4 zinc finger [Anatilimnocola aggregata]|uniref:Topoisomerase DNA binding C4 zinc finger n=1 Tax=Anatilimnocola aggregata TaxID=2528021 RepID=A0A517Y6L7_9BACT|nr:DUF2726 domain-containing protein [Anatilimnocola aggregata]QDU25856.1 Topoisomerase DNA binding C4 zinc finger [Anatilimnocola aggregata]
MTDAEPKGCLAAILSLFGISLGGPAKVSVELPYRQRDDFLSAAELSFYRVLATALGNRAVVCPKVSIADIFFVVRPNENQSYRNKIDRKHVDFLLCDPMTMKPRCGVELDDSSHARRDRQERDEFVDEVFEVAGLPLVRVPAKSAYSPAALLAFIEPHLSGPVANSLPPDVQSSGPPACPKCGVLMVERVAKKGQSAGQSFFGCPNYPKCREIVQSL